MDIRSFILANKKPSYQSTDKREVRVRCPYCGDSKKNLQDAHFYIAMKPPFMFHCFKCEVRGTLNPSVMRDLGLYDNDANVAIINETKKYKANQNIQTVSYRKKQLIYPIVDTERSAVAVNYFNNRFGTNFTNQELVTKFRAITDPLEFFRVNDIRIKLSQYGFENSIGFASADNSHVIFRDVSGQQEQRYFNLRLIPADEETTVSKMYNITSGINAMANKITLVITEGIFDIIGVYLNVFDGRETDEIIFAAGCGKAYNAVISNYIRKGFLDLDVVIFSDNDVDLTFYKNLKNTNPYLKNSKLTVYYNTLEKDYGIRKEKINLRKIML